LADISIQQGQAARDALPLVESGIIVDGVILLVLGSLGVVQKILFLFTPLVTGSFLLLLALQLRGVLFERMLSVSEDALRPDYGIALISFGVFALIILMSNKGRGWVKRYAVLIVIFIGWGLDLLTGKASIYAAINTTVMSLP